MSRNVQIAFEIYNDPNYNFPSGRIKKASIKKRIFFLESPKVLIPLRIVIKW